MCVLLSVCVLGSPKKKSSKSKRRSRESKESSVPIPGEPVMKIEGGEVNGIVNGTPEQTTASEGERQREREGE